MMSKQVKARLAVQVAGVLFAVAVTGCAQMPGTQAPATAPDQRISVETVGKGRDIILMPGIGASKDVMRPLANRLAGTHRSHLVQVAGFAGLPAPSVGDGPVLAPVAKAVADYIAANGIKDAMYIGHSGGGAIGLMLALDHPGSISRLMVVDVLPFPAVLDGPGDKTPATVGAKAAAERDQMLKQTTEEFASAHRKNTANAVVSKEDADRVHAWSVASDRKVLSRAYYDLGTMDLRPRMASSSVPLTVVFADQASHGAPPGWMHKRYTTEYKDVPKVQFEEIKNARHFLLLDQPEAFYQAVQRFVQ